MATAKAIQISITHVTLGLLMGTLIETVMPSQSASSSVGETAFEAFAQVGLNGALLSVVGASLTSDDPTYGIPFALALERAQPGLLKRLSFLAGVGKDQVAGIARRKEPPAEAAV